MSVRFQRFALPIAALLWMICGLVCHAQTDGLEWKRCDVDGVFSIEMPGDPQIQTQKVDTPAGELSIKMYMVQIEGGTRTFVVAATDLPAILPEPKGAEIEQRLDGAEQGSAANIKGKLLSSKKIKLDGFAGRDIVIQGPLNILVRGRTYLIRRTLIQAQAVNVNSKDVERFLDSLKLGKAENGPAETK